MKISFIEIQNFRKLKQCRIDFGKNNTLFVGPNNSGKTSAMEALGKFLGKRNFNFNDITLSNHILINKIGEEWINQGEEFKETIEIWEKILPILDLWIDVEDNEIQYVTHVIPNLDWKGGKVGVRLMLQPSDISTMIAEYVDLYKKSREVEEKDENGKDRIKLWPKTLCEYIEKRMPSIFTIRAYILDPEKISTLEEVPQTTDYEMECSEQRPLERIICVDMIEAQRGFYDPETAITGSDNRNLSNQLRNYYDKHLDPEKSPTVEDLNILKAMEEAKKTFNDNLEEKFRTSINELENLGYPGINNPTIKIETKVNAKDALKHESAVKYEIAHSNSEEIYCLPEQYNGLGYQNLISMVFRLISFRDDWMRVGKSKKNTEKQAIEPIHLVLIEEPEAHLHMQVQQVFIKHAYKVLTDNEFLKKNSNFCTQLIISTHSSHIVKEVEFSDLRYFKRLELSEEYTIPTTTIINLSDVFGNKENETNKFITRYLKTTHCDIFFADALILVEGTAENMLLPHFIHNKYPILNQMYISILEINGRHSHRLRPLIEKIGLTTLIITDIDSVSPEGHHSHKEPKREEGIITTNYAITNWILELKSLDDLLDLESDRKVKKYNKPSDFFIRIAYQIPIDIQYKNEKIEAIASTFEDSLIYNNFEFFSNETEKDGVIFKIQNTIAKCNNFQEIHKNIYEEIRDKNFHKAEFALDLIFSKDPNEIQVPNYIEEGLEWLEEQLKKHGKLLEGE